MDTLAAAAKGDPESIGWVLVLVLATVLVLIAFFQTAVGDASVSKAKRIGKSIPPPTYNVGLPVLGNIFAFAKNPLDLVWEGYAKKGEVFTVRLGPKRLTFLIGPAACETFFKASDTELDQSEPYRFSVPVFGKDVVYDAVLEKRLQHFKVLSMTLRVNMLETYVPLMIKEAEEFFATWGDEGELDLFEQLSHLIILTGSRCIMGREIRENLFGEVSHLIHDLDQGMQPISILANWLPIKAHRDRDRAREQIGKLFEPIIRSRRSGETKEDDMLQWLIDAKYRDGDKFTEHEIVGILVAGLFAAQHTSSATSTWTGMRMLRNKEVLQRVREEQEAVLSNNGGKLDYSALIKMNLLHACMKETLRMHPPLIFLMRKVLEPRPALGGRYVIPQNDIVVASPSVAGMLPDVFPEPTKWDPDRFLPPRDEDKIAPFSFLGFGAGRHGCMGEGFAYVQVKTIWSILLRLFDLEAIGDAVPEPNYDALVVGPKLGTCPIKYKRRVPLSA